MSAALAHTLRNAASAFRTFAIDADDGDDHYEQLATACATAVTELSVLRPALARLYLAVVRAKLGRAATLRELDAARLEARRALGVRRGAR